MEVVDILLAATVVLAGIAVVLAVLRAARRDNSVPAGPPNKVLGLTLPDRGEPGSISAADAAELRGRAAISADDTWLSHEQARMVLNSLRFGDAVWQDRCGQSGPLPAGADKAVLEVFLHHDSYLMDLDMLAQGRGVDHDSLPDDACTRHLHLTLNGFLAEARNQASDAGPPRPTA